MSRNEFGVEESDGGGFSFGGSNNIEDMLEEAAGLSVADDEVSTGERSNSFRRHSKSAPKPVEVAPKAPENSFSNSDNFEDMFETATNLSVSEDSEVRSNPEIDYFDLDDDSNSQDTYSNGEAAESTSNNFENPDSFAGFEDSKWDAEDDAPIDGGYGNEPETVTEVPVAASFEPEPTVAPPVRPTPATIVVAPAPVPVVEPIPVQVERIVEPMVKPVSISESDVDYIEKVILTSDAIRQLPEDDAKATNIFITGGIPVGSHQELVLAALLADRQILKTADAILEAKSNGSVDRAFYILGLDDRTFKEFGQMISNDLDASDTVIFEGDRLRYARRLVDVVEGLTDGSIKRFEAVQSVLQAGELSE